MFREFPRFNSFDLVSEMLLKSIALTKSNELTFLWFDSNLYNSQITDAQDSFEIFTESMEVSKLDDAERDALEGK